MTTKNYEVKKYADAKEYYLNGKLHRKAGPAIEYANGAEEYYLNGKLHRDNGPAVKYANGNKYWYLYDREYTEAKFNAKKAA